MGRRITYYYVMPFKFILQFRFDCSRVADEQLFFADESGLQHEVSSQSGPKPCDGLHTSASRTTKTPFSSGEQQVSRPERIPVNTHSIPSRFCEAATHPPRAHTADQGASPPPPGLLFELCRTVRHPQQAAGGPYTWKLEHQCQRSTSSLHQRRLFTDDRTDSVEMSLLS
jgi:hypothetical protein